MDIIIGTAGHIDHGKTSLVRALTGIDTDRLPEEKKRGITIDLGFAELAIESLHIGFVDVPGHEKFVKNMLAGVGGIDLLLLVVAADEGVMPQTREHFEIARLLGIKRGLIALTKSDMVDKELLEIAKLDVAELVSDSFLEEAPIIPVSSKTGIGLEDLRRGLLRVGAQVSERAEEKISILPIDRVFTVKGFGTVVTGTLRTGAMAAGEEIEILPSGGKARIRGLQTHDKNVERAHSGQRTAVNLGGIDHSEISRGDLLAEPEILAPTQMIDAQIEVLKNSPRDLRSRQRVRVHLGTIEALARVQVLNDVGKISPGDSDMVQLRFEVPVVAIAEDRLILRQYSPQVTLGGGIILDVFPKKHRKNDFKITRNFLDGMVSAIEGKDHKRQAELLIRRASSDGISASELRAQTGWTETFFLEIISQLVKSNEILGFDQTYISRESFESSASETLERIETYHRAEPLSRGISREILREQVYLQPLIFRAVLEHLERGKLVQSKADVVFSLAYRQELSPAESVLKERIEKIYSDAGLSVPQLDEALSKASENIDIAPDTARKIFQLLLDSSTIIKIAEGMYFDQEAIKGLIIRLHSHAAKSDENRYIGVPEFKELAGISRKYAIPLLEYFDAQKITRRAGDKRMIL